MSGNHHLCSQAQATIIGHRGGFASHIRVHWAWAFRMPARLNFSDAGPMLCGGVTVFAPLVRYAKPTDRVGIIGIGGLGHMAVKFAAAYGCDVTAFTASESKFTVVHVAAGIAAVIVALGQQAPAGVLLAGDVRLGGVALGIETVEFLVQALFGRLAGVNGTADDRERLSACGGWGHESTPEISGAM
jgi:uncharacterized zinc-type alcohol dehydrogenase-like protein